MPSHSLTKAQRLKLHFLDTLSASPAFVEARSAGAMRRELLVRAFDGLSPKRIMGLIDAALDELTAPPARAPRRRSPR